MSSVDEYEVVIETIQQMLGEETAAWVESGSAVLELVEGGAELRPTSDGPCAVMVYVQSEREVSLFPTAPGTDRVPTIDVFDEDAAALVDEVRAYVRAILTGRVELTLRQGSAAGRVRLWLSDGSTQTHLYNVFFGFLVGGSPRWDTFRPTPY